jgi:hypothetical protein
MGAPAPAELELERKRRGRSSSFASSISQELLLGVAGGLPQAFAELVEQLLSEGEEAAVSPRPVIAPRKSRTALDATLPRYFLAWKKTGKDTSAMR